MKNLLLSALAVSALALSASAQGISVGPRIGVNFANIKASDGADAAVDAINDNAESKTGFLFGAVLNLGITESFSVQPELLYIQQGTKFDGEQVIYDPTTGFPIGTANVKATTTNNYLQLPVLAKYSFGSDDFKVFVNAGPYAGYWLGGKSKMEMGDNEKEEDHKFDDDDADGVKDNRLDFGLVGGAGVGFNAGPGMLTLDLRYGYGLSDHSKYKDERPETDPKVSNRGFNVSLSYMFGMGK